MLSNMPVIRYVLKVTNLKKFDNNLFYSCAFKTEEDFLEVMKDERLHYDTEDFKGLEILIKYDFIDEEDNKTNDSLSFSVIVFFILVISYIIKKYFGCK